LAEQKLEELKGLPYASISGGSEQDIIVGNMSFDRITIVSPPEDEDFEDDMQEVVVTVSWTEKGATQEVRLATVIAK